MQFRKQASPFLTKWLSWNWFPTVLSVLWGC